MMKKKSLLILLCLSLCACIVGCNKSNEKNGTDIFGEKLDSVSEILYYFPDETIYTIDDAEQVKTICNILKNEVYTESEEKSEIEGGHLFEFVGDETLKIGLVQKYLLYDGTEYTASDEDAFQQIYDIIKELKEEH